MRCSVYINGKSVYLMTASFYVICQSQLRTPRDRVPPRGYVARWVPTAPGSPTRLAGAFANDHRRAHRHSRHVGPLNRHMQHVVASAAYRRLDAV